MRVVIAGGSGFLGRALSEALAREGYDVLVLSRGAGESTGPRTVSWTPEDGGSGPWTAALDGADAVVNLAGASIAGGRWTAPRKAAILDSRINATRSLARALLGARHPPAVFVSASAQGYYGHRGDAEVTEDDPPGEDFLARVCVAWEAEAAAVANHARLVLLRTGIVLSAHAGALPEMVRPFRLFAGGPVGDGRQFLPWVHWRDWVGMASWALQATAVNGPVNVSAPTPARNRDLAAAIGRVLHRPSWLPVPAMAVRAALGEMGEALLLTSTRMIPARALALGYPFRFTGLGEALANVLAGR